MVKTKKLPYEPISTLRQTVLKYFEEVGECFRGSILHTGSGPDTFNYKQYFPNAERYLCLNKWGGLGGGNFPNVDIHANVQYMPEVSDNSVDVLLATFYLFQVEDIHAAFREFKRVLKPNGLFIATLTGAGWKGNPHFHKWAKSEVQALVSQYFTLKKSDERDIGTFVVAINDK